MKNISLYYILVLSFIISSCSDLLDKKPINLISDSNVWENENMASAFLVSPYKDMLFLFNEFPINAEYAPLMWGHADISSVCDEGTSWYLASSNQGVDQICYGIITNTDNQFQDIWDKVYQTIRAFNLFLNKMETSPLPEEIKNKLSAQARWGRAMCYFALVKRYGAVPLITKLQWTTDPIEELYPKRNSEQEIYDFIINECDEIFDQLPDSELSGRPSKWAALAVKSRAALFAASIAKYGKLQLDGLLGIPADKANYYWEICYSASEEILNSGKYSLYNKYPEDKIKNFQQLFVDEGNSEVIYYYPFSGSGYSGIVSGYDMMMGPYSKVAWGGSLSNVYLEMVNEFENIDGSSGVFDEDKFTAPNTTWSIKELWGKKDPRFLGSIYTQETPWQGDKIDMHIGLRKDNGELLEGTDVYYKGVISTGLDGKDSRGLTGFSVRKYINESKIRPDNYQSDQDWPSIRLAEIKLNKAEAAIELGKNEEALKEINDIRARAGIQLLSNINLDKVRHERKVELAFEGFRWFDLRRWRIADKVLDSRKKPFHGLRYILDYNSTLTGGDYKYELQIIPGGTGDNYKIFPEKLYYIPIKQQRIANNENLKPENPGY